MALFSTGVKIEYVAGVGKTFVIPFTYLDVNHIYVDVNGVPLQNGVGYTVSPPGTGGTVTLAAQPPAGATIRVYRVVPLRQMVDLAPQNAPDPELLETALDYAMMVAQQINGGLYVATVWDHGIWPGGNLHALVTKTVAGFMPPWLYAKLTDPSVVPPGGGAAVPPLDVFDFIVDEVDRRLLKDDFTIGKMPGLQDQLDIRVDWSTFELALNQKLPITYKPVWGDVQFKPDFDLLYKPKDYAPTWGEVTGKPNFDSLYKPISYVPTWGEVTAKPDFDNLYKAKSYVPAWSEISGKPATFPSTWATVSGKPTTLTGYGVKVEADGLYKPIGYVPAWTDITGKPTNLAGYGVKTEADGLYKPIGYVPAWGEVTGKPLTFPPSAHDHDGAYPRLIDFNDLVVRVEALESGGGGGGPSSGPLHLRTVWSPVDVKFLIQYIKDYSDGAIKIDSVQEVSTGVVDVVFGSPIPANYSVIVSPGMSSDNKPMMAPVVSMSTTFFRVSFFRYDGTAARPNFFSALIDC